MLELIDTHFHVWDLDTQDLPWLATTDGSITRTWTFDQLLEAYRQQEDINFRGAVVVEADTADAAQEVELTKERRAAHPEILGAVLRTDLTENTQLPEGIVGIREPLHIDSQPRGRCLEEGFLAGLAQLAQHGLTFDACIRVGELSDLYQAAAQVPEARIVIDHLGNVESLDTPYRDAMTQLASLPNVFCKVSGLPNTDNTANEGILSFVTELFGTTRLMYASNWPVVSLYSSFVENLALLRGFYGDDADIFHRTAQRCYGL
ncbi:MULTISPECIES: amidohydrolase family protein [Actinotignum]|uniref:amidohydrolase family protein n=1 Tax=Actinotignum TaxID=1653174 RepID=UPI00254EA15E|nr:amidohydrolase family protein [Actinotignum schaalii]